MFYEPGSIVPFAFESEWCRFFFSQPDDNWHVCSLFSRMCKWFFDCAIMIWNDLKRRLQDSVRSRLGNYLLTGDEASEEDRITDIRFVVEQVTRFVWFFFLVKDIPVKKFNQDKEFNASFYGTTHKQIVKKIERRKCFGLYHRILSSCYAVALSSVLEPEQRWAKSSHGNK